MGQDTLQKFNAIPKDFAPTPIPGPKTSFVICTHAHHPPSSFPSTLLSTLQQYYLLHNFCPSHPFFLPVWGFLSLMCSPSLFLKPGKRRCCRYGGGAIELFPLRKRRHACTLEENIQVWNQAVQVSETQGKQFCNAQPPLP